VAPKTFICTAIDSIPKTFLIKKIGAELRVVRDPVV
jgi:hypothetical protein